MKTPAAIPVIARMPPAKIARETRLKPRAATSAGPTTPRR